jgi:glycerol uptake facilitator-like aquaporin
MELDHGIKFRREVCIYECAGTALLVYAVNVSKADPVAICFSLFTAIMIGGPVSGGHYNPAVSCGVFIS